jgi:hypothetical protein
VRTPICVATIVAAALLTSPGAADAVLAAAAGALVESAPFLLAGAVAARFAGRHAGWIAYAGCGCGQGPSARSLPAAAATWLVFGPAVALARLAAGIAVARLGRGRFPAGCAGHGEPGLLTGLSAVLPAALAAGVLSQALPLLQGGRIPPVLQAAAGAALGFAAPCALGTVALAGSLRAHAMPAAAALLCVAGIADLRALRRFHAHEGPAHDAFAYALLAVALGIVALRHGDALVHPALAFVVGACAVGTALLAIVHRTRSHPRLRAAPAFMLLGALIAAPPPAYRATETTLADLFAGERLRFTGRLTEDGRNAALVRYAITCCRADASPVVVRLLRSPHAAPGTWLYAAGTIAPSPNGDLRLNATKLHPVAPPTDPFIYR